MFLWLDESLSDGGASRDGNGDTSSHCLGVDDGFIVHFFGQDWSVDFHFSDDGGLDYSLSDDGLSDGLFSDGRLHFHFSLNFGLREEFLGLVDLGSGVEDVSSH